MRGGTIAAIATALMATHVAAGIALAVVGFLCIGFGVGASGTTLLVLLATRTDERRRPAAATIVWVMMIAGFIVTAATAGSLLDPFSPARLVAVASGVSLAAFVLSLIAVWGIEGDALPSARQPASAATRVVSCRRWPRSGPSRRRGASGFSCSSRCSLSARRT